MRRRWLTIACAPALLATGALAMARRPAPRPAPGLSSAAIREQDIGFFERRVREDPSGAIDLVRLGGLYLGRFRSEGNEADLVTAEAAARRSLSHRAERNPGALQLLTASLLGQHRFVEAKAAAERVVALDPDDPMAQASLGEVQLELGEYPAADSTFRRLTPRRYHLALAPRYARWLELRGHVGEARRLLEWARAETARHDSAAEPLAWFDLRLGELALRFGAYGEARRRLEQGLARAPDQWRLLAARARLALATGDVRGAIVLGDSSLTRHLDPATLALVGDAWRTRGDTAQAGQYYRALEAATQAPRGGFHRVWYLALLDHDRRIPEVLAAVTRDLETRRDVYGYDLLAWALYKSHRIREARGAMREALAWGTEDPLLHDHARAIAAGSP